MCWYRPALLPLLLAPLLSLGGCGQPNRAVAADDLPITVELDRHWIRSTASSSWTSDDWIDLEAEWTPRDCRDILYIPFVVAFHLLLEGGINLGAYGLTMADSTTVTVEANGRSDYRQRLYWGSNTVYFPSTSPPDTSFLTIEVTGDRTLQTRVPINPHQVRLIQLQ